MFYPGADVYLSHRVVTLILILELILLVNLMNSHLWNINISEYLLYRLVLLLITVVCIKVKDNMYFLGRVHSMSRSP